MLLLVDDAFLVHELVGPRYFRIPEGVFLAAYGVISAIYLYSLRRTRVRVEWLLVSVTFFFFGSSLFLDQVLPFTSAATYLEDACKFAGIIFWVTFHGRLATTLLAPASHQNGAVRQG